MRKFVSTVLDLDNRGIAVTVSSDASFDLFCVCHEIQTLDEGGPSPS